MKTVTEYFRLFKQMQRDEGFRDVRGNVVQDKWSMKDIIEDIDDNRKLEKLFKFFFHTTPDKSMKYFIYNYSDYLDTMEAIIADRRARKNLLEKTVKGKN